MKILLLIAKLLGAMIAALLLLGVFYVAFALLRTSVPFVFSSDLERLAASGPMNDQVLATAICGKPVDFLGAPDIASPATALPRARLIGWRPIYPMSGAATARVVGVGVNRGTMEAITAPCQATVAFKYRFEWVDNGRAIVRQSEFLEPPEIVPPEQVRE